MAQLDYIVIVYPPPPATRGDVKSSYSHDRHAPKVTMVTASSPQKAAETVGVSPGGHAFVVQKSQTRRFDRATQAPLIEQRPSGGDFPAERTQETR